MSFSIFSGMYLKMRGLTLGRLNSKFVWNINFIIIKKSGDYFSNIYAFIMLDKRFFNSKSK